MLLLRGGLAPLTLATYMPVSSWWLSGGVSAANAIGVYVAKGAASLAASYTNLANPGTYDLIATVAPTWDATNGWIFNGSSQYLRTGIAPTNNQTWSIIVRYSNSANAGALVAAGAATGSGTFQIWPTYNGNVIVIGSGLSVNLSPGLAGGVVAIAGNRAYRNGVAEGAALGTSVGTFAALLIGARATSTGDPQAGTYGANRIQALAIYNATLTTGQITSLVTAINLL